MATKYVHPAEPAVELLIEHALLDILPDLVRVVRSADLQIRLADAFSVSSGTGDASKLEQVSVQS